MISSTLLLFAGMMTGDYAVRCSAQDGGQAAVWTYAPAGNPPTGIRFKYGAGLPTLLPMAANTTWPYSPDVDATGQTTYAAVWTAVDQGNTRRVYLCVAGGAPMLVGVFGAINESPGLVARVGIRGNRIYVAWIQGSGLTSFGFKGPGTRIWVQAFNASGTTATAAGAPKQVNAESRRSELTFGDIATDRTSAGGFAVTFVRTEGGESASSGVFLKRYASLSPTGDIGVVFGETAMTGTGGGAAYYSFSELASYADGASVVAYNLGTSLYQQHWSAAGASLGVPIQLSDAGGGITAYLGEEGPGVTSMFFAACDKNVPPSGDYVVTWSTKRLPGGGSLFAAQNIVSRRRVGGILGGIAWHTSSSSTSQPDITNSGPCVGHPYSGAPLDYQRGGTGNWPQTLDTIQFIALP